MPRRFTWASSAGLATLSLTIFLALLSGCGSNNNHSATTSPGSPPSFSSTGSFSVTTVSPALGATAVPINATVQITFSSAANATSVNTTDIKLTDPEFVIGTVAYHASTNMATFTPSGVLDPNTAFTLTVSGVTSSSGTAMASPFSSTFTTGLFSAPTTQYQAPLLSQPGETTINGQVSIDTNGEVTVQLTNAAASMSFSVQFCPAVNESISGIIPACFGVGVVSSDSTGSGSATAMFPQPGDWAGNFGVNSGSSTEYKTGLVPGLNSETYMSTLQPQTAVNGIGVAAGTIQDPLNIGVVTYSNGTVLFTVAGTSPETTFTTNESESRYVDSSGTYALSTFMTNAIGNGSLSTTLSGAGGDLSGVNPQIGAGFIGGFSVPSNFGQ